MKKIKKFKEKETNSKHWQRKLTIQITRDCEEETKAKEHNKHRTNNYTSRKFHET